MEWRKDLSVRIRAKIKPSGSARIMSIASVIQYAPLLRETTPMLYVARYRYNPGTMITIAGTVIDIREYPILPFERDASIPAVRAPAKAAIDGGQEARSTSSRRRVLAMAPMTPARVASF